MEKGVCRQPKAVPARGGFEPSAPGGRCSEGRIGRNREYCKRQRSKTTIFQPAFVDTNGCEWPKGERLKDAKCREVFPLSLCAAAHRQLPSKRWRLLVQYKLQHKASPGGEADKSVSEWTEGLNRSCSRLRQPLSHGLRRASSPFGEPFGITDFTPH